MVRVVHLFSSPRLEQQNIEREKARLGKWDGSLSLFLSVAIRARGARKNFVLKSFCPFLQQPKCLQQERPSSPLVPSFYFLFFFPSCSSVCLHQLDGSNTIQSTSPSPPYIFFFLHLLFLMYIYFILLFKLA